MDTLRDYILWMSDFTFAETGFRDVDALVLSNLAYYNFTMLFAGADGPVYVRDAQKILDAGKVEVEIAIADNKYTDLLQAAVCSRRFGNLRISDYIDIKRTDPPVQYAVMTFHDEEDLSFIAFRGTDDSLAGWYEDFVASFCETEAQVMAKDYVEQMLQKIPSGRWMMGGHSKGGNLAVYAGCTMDPSLFERVERIYNLDGPGLSKDVMGEISTDPVMKKTICIQPEFSIVGKLFDMHFPNTRIIKSFAHGAFQHAPITWGVDHGKIASAEAHNPLSVWFNEFIARWIERSSVEERKIFLGEIYEAISSGGSTTLAELAGEGWDGFRRIQTRLKNASEVTKRVMYEFTKEAFFASLFPGQKQLEHNSAKKHKK